MNHPVKRVEFIQKYLDGIFAEDLHAKRVVSLANGTLGVMTSASLAVSIVGQSLAQARGLLSKHAIKQAGRLLSNQGIAVWDMFVPWVAEAVGPRKSIVVAMDWTDFDAGDRTALALNLVTTHGRATPLLWLTVLKDELKDRRNDYEDLCLARQAEILPEGVAVTILADRGFGDTKLFAYLDTLGFAYVIRFRGNIHVSAADGETRAAAAWVGASGRARKLRDAEVTTARHKAGAVARIAGVGHRRRHGEQCAYGGEVLRAGAAGQKPVMADAVEAFRQHMRQKTADELGRLDRHGFVTAGPLDAVVLVREGHAVLVSGNQAPVRDRNPVRVAREVGQYGSGPGKWALGIDEPLGLSERRQESGERIRIGEMRMLAKEAQLAGLVRGGKLLKHKPPEQLGERQHWQQEAAPAGDPALTIQR
jgi:hypothetical protein